jgi:hypothetical protein
MNTQKYCRRGTLFIGALGFAWLSGCAVLPGEKRHSAEDIARYQPNDFVATIASAQGEREARAEVEQKILEALAVPIGTDPNAAIPGALWNIGFLNTKRDEGLPMLLAAISTLPEKDPAYQRGILSGAYALYARESAPAVASILAQIRTPREFAMAAYTILESDNSPQQRDFIRKTMQEIFAGEAKPGEKIWQTEPRLRQLNWMLTNDRRDAIKRRPPLVDLLAHPWGHAEAGRKLPVIFSFQRQDRRRFGLAVVRGADGKFVRNPDGSIFNVPHLANAITNLPGTITNGNTPQGLFTITHSETATNKWIGPTPYLYSKVPGEATLAEYLHLSPTAIRRNFPNADPLLLLDAENHSRVRPEVSKDILKRDALLDGASIPQRERDLLNAAVVSNTWNDSAYQAFLPEKWRGYWPFMEAYLAGQAGRDEMLIHGTTINSNYYTGKSYFPGTPSAGCLVAMEYWSKEEGRMIRSDQLALIKAFARDGGTQGYLVVVELDGRLEPVSLNDVVGSLVEAEQQEVKSKSQ